MDGKDVAVRDRVVQILPYFTIHIIWWILINVNSTLKWFLNEIESRNR